MGMKEVENLKVRFKFLPGDPIKAKLLENCDRNLDLAVLRVNLQESEIPHDKLRNWVPFDKLGYVSDLQEGDKLYAIGHPPGGDWVSPKTPCIDFTIEGENIKFRYNCDQGYSGGAIFDDNWRLVGMIKDYISPYCRAVSFLRICDTLNAWNYNVSLRPVEIIPEFINETDASEMVLIPEGKFLMGSSEGQGEDDEYPKHSVHLDSFYIDKYEVTNAQYKKFIDETGHKSEGNWLESYSSGKEDHPVVNVSWNDAAAYAQWAGKRLPTEAEWEKAARGGLEDKLYPWGDVLDESKANYIDSEHKTTQPVGSYSPNEFGLFNAAGNVWEWCSDYYAKDYYRLSPTNNPSGPSRGNFRVIRGGSWASTAKFLRVARRYRCPQESSYSFLGFRCAKNYEN